MPSASLRVCPQSPEPGRRFPEGSEECSPDPDPPRKVEPKAGPLEPFSSFPLPQADLRAWALVPWRKGACNAALRGGVGWSGGGESCPEPRGQAVAPCPQCCAEPPCFKTAFWAKRPCITIASCCLFLCHVGSLEKVSSPGSLEDFAAVNYIIYF